MIREKADGRGSALPTRSGSHEAVMGASQTETAELTEAHHPRTVFLSHTSSLYAAEGQASSEPAFP